MGFINWFYIEPNEFELSVPDGGSVLRLVERRLRISCMMLVDKFSIVGLKKSMEKIVCSPEESDFLDSSKEGNKAFIAQKSSNRAGRFVEIAEYRVGGRRGLIVVPKGRQGRGWKLFAAELGKVVALFSCSPG
jgi:hypothetical protein